MITSTTQNRLRDARAADLKNKLECIGLMAEIQVKAQVTKVLVFRNGQKKGAAGVRVSGLDTVVDTHEIRDMAVKRATEACAEGRIADARRILMDDDTKRAHAPTHALHIATCDQELPAGKMAYGAAVYRGEHLIHRIGGLCDGGEHSARATAATEGLEWCDAQGIKALRLYDDAHVMKWAEGVFTARADAAKIWLLTYKKCGVRVSWMPANRKSGGYGEARQAAIDAMLGDDDGSGAWWRSRAA